MSLDAAMADLAEALRTIDGLRVYPELGANVDPPGVAFGPAAFTWELMTSEPTEAILPVALVVSNVKGGRTYAEMMEWLPRIAEAIETLPNAVVRRADPGTWPAGGGDLPAYLFQVELALPWR